MAYSSVEAYLALGCACLPPLRPIFAKWRFCKCGGGKASNTESTSWVSRGTERRNGRGKGSSDTDLIHDEEGQSTSGGHVYRLGTSSTTEDNIEVIELAQLEPAKTKRAHGSM